MGIPQGSSINTRSSYNPPTINFNGLQYKEPSFGQQLLGFGVGTLNTTLSILLANSLNNSTQTTETTELTPEEQTAQAANVEAVNIARTMSSSQIKSELNYISSQIDKASQELTSLNEQALGEKSQAYIANEANIKSMEDEYGFAAGSIQDNKDASALAKAGDAYQQACDTYDNLVKGQNECNLKKQELANSIAELGSDTEGTIGDVQKEINGYDTQINNLKQNLPTDKGGTAKEGSTKLNATQTNLVQEQISQLEDKKAAAEKRKNELVLKQKQLQQEQTTNNNKLATDYTDEKINKAQEAMKKLATFGKGDSAVDLSAKYTEYKQLISNRTKIKSDAAIAQNTIESKNTELSELKTKLAIYKQAGQIKDKITTDDTNAANTKDGDYKGKAVGKGSWFSRNFGWMWFKGNTAKTQRRNNATFNQMVNQYMFNHGCSKEEAQKAVRDLQGLQTVQAQNTTSTG